MAKKKSANNNTLDLHGVKHQDVKQLLDSSIWECMQKSKPRLWVITGNSDEMKQIVVSVVSEYGLCAVENLFSSAELIIEL